MEPWLMELVFVALASGAIAVHGFLREHKNRKETRRVDQARDILSRADLEGRELTADEDRRFHELMRTTPDEYRRIFGHPVPGWITRPPHPGRKPRRTR